MQRPVNRFLERSSRLMPLSDDVRHLLTRADAAISRRIEGDTRVALDVEVVRPLSSAESRIAALLDEPPSGESQYRSSRPLEVLAAMPGRGRVLVAEDNPVNQIVISKMLEKLGCRVVVAANGEDVIRLAKGAAFDLVLMDLQMPIVDGFTATAIIREHEGDARHTPIVALTANAMQGDRERCIDAGMDDYLSKPIDPALLRGAVERWMAA